VSSYETYDVTSQNYDQTRIPVGAEIILGCLTRQGRPLADLTVLDAGCGTGSYSKAIVGHVGRIEALDMSQGMLAEARAKHEAEAADGRIDFHQGSISELPFDSGSLDGVMINQVLHHLPDDAAAGYPLHRQAFAEFARVLKPGGTLTINSCSQDQISDAYWYYHLAPRGRGTMAAGFVPLDAIEAMLGDVGLTPRGRFVPVDAICQGAAYFHSRGPLEKPWRDGDSFWARVDEDELAEALVMVRDLDAAGTLDAFIAEHDKPRRHLGQITFLAAGRD
jgi:SAM-dependent methyltransferase